VGLRGRMRRLERLAEGGLVSIPQPDGPPVKFPASDLEAAFLANTRRLVGEDVPAHPLSEAAARSPDPKWRETLYASAPVGEAVEDLSE
jgi:hypothetical protein